MEKVKNFKDLEVWKKGIELTVKVYKTAQKLPGSEKFGLTSQMQRAAVSVPANIAEGWSRNHTKEFIQFSYMAIGSLAELQTFNEVLRKLGYADTKEIEGIEAVISELQKMLYSLVKSLASRL